MKLLLEGNTLGERHRHYNKLLKESLGTTLAPDRINFDEDDVNNMIKIDIACKTRNVDYIMEVLKCEDMLYVSRAIKRSTWLITDKQYAHIINPKYLLTNVFPQMTFKAIQKLLLHIKLNLKDETRAEAFYSSLNKYLPNLALKWLPYCSIAFIEEVVTHRACDMSLKLLKQLSKKSIKILRTFLPRYNDHTSIPLNATMFLLKNNTEEYLDIIESISKYEGPQFSVKATRLIMKKCPERIIKNFDNYAHGIHLPTFAKEMKNKDMEMFLMEHASRDPWWPTFDNLQHFFVDKPKEDIIEMLKSIFDYKTDDKAEDGNRDANKPCDLYTLFYAIERYTHIPSNVYRWYQFALFDVAFHDIKKLIYAESSPDERTSMLLVLLNCAGRNMDHIQFLLQYYHDKHINEPFNHKKQFVNNVLTQTDTHKYDDNTWNILNELFHSMEVYIQSKNNVQLCVKSIIIYKVLHGHVVPDIIEDKFYFNTLKKYQKKLNHQERQKIFEYLYNYLITRLRKHNMKNELSQAMKVIEDIWTLVKDWNNENVYNSLVVEEINELINIQRKSSGNINGLSSLYKMIKGWRRLLFDQSIALCPSDDVCVNVLKHAPELLVCYRSEVEAMYSDDAVSLKKFLSKLRIYWPESLASECSSAYNDRLKSITGHRSIVRGLYALLPRQQLLEFLKMYTPTETKIHWSEVDEIKLSLRRHIAKGMHLARPQLPSEVVLWYAKGDYLQYTVLSLNAIYYNLKRMNLGNHIEKLLSAPVSLLKHGIRLVFATLNTKELLPISSNCWKSTKNCSIRAVLFTGTFKLLCKETKPTVINEIWEILNTFIADLSHQENKNIYFTLGKVKEVPLCTISKFYSKAYEFIKSLPSERDYHHELLDDILDFAPEIMEYLDSDFVEGVLLESVPAIFTQHSTPYLRIIASYLLCSEDEESQMHKYNNVLGPLLHCSVSNLRHSLNDIFKHLCDYLPKYVFDKDMVIPVTMLTNLQNALERDLSIQKGNEYVMQTNWKLAVAYIKIIDELDNNFEYTWKEMQENAAPLFGEICVQHLKHDINTYFPSIYELFADALLELFRNFNYDHMTKLTTLKSMLNQKDVVHSYLLVLKILPPEHYMDELKRKRKEICKMLYYHSSIEIRMHYKRNIKDNYNFETHVPEEPEREETSINRSYRICSLI